MQERGIELQNAITKGKKTLKNMEDYMAEVVQLTSEQEAKAQEYKSIIAANEEEKRQEEARKKELRRIKTKIALKR